MNILYKRNTHSGSEDEMQKDLPELLFTNRLYDGAKNINIYREVPCPQVGRISDIVLSIRHKMFYNIECKIVDIQSVLKQAKDHLRWADYSYVCLKHDTYIATYQIKEMIEFGIGLLLWKPGELMECVQSSKSKFINENLRSGVIETIKMINPI